jgi:hypothetical protein
MFVAAHSGRRHPCQERGSSGRSEGGSLAVVVVIAALLDRLRRTRRFFSPVSLSGTIGHQTLNCLLGMYALVRPVRRARY